MELYYQAKGEYLTNKTYPPSIGDYLSPTPLDPATGEPYGWADNTANNQRYCVYAKLQKGDYFVCTEKKREMLGDWGYCRNEPEPCSIP